MNLHQVYVIMGPEPSWDFMNIRQARTWPHSPKIAGILLHATWKHLDLQLSHGMGTTSTACTGCAVPYSPSMETTECPYLWVSRWIVGLYSYHPWEMGDGWIQILIFLKASRRHLEGSFNGHTSQTSST